MQTSQVHDAISQVKPAIIILTGQPPTHRKGRRNYKILLTVCRAFHQQGFHVYITTPNQIRLIKKRDCRIHAWFMSENGVSARQQWIPVHQPLWLDLVLLPDMKRDRVSYQKFVRVISMTGGKCLNGILPNKYMVFQALTKSKLNFTCIPETKLVNRFSDIRQMMKKSRVVWIKPIHGSGANGAFRLTRISGRKIRIDSGKKLRTTSVSNDVQTIRRLLKKRNYICQAEVPVRHTTDKRVMDVRVTLARGKGGTWHVVGTTLRKGRKDGIVTNYHAGGSVCSIELPEHEQWLADANMTKSALKRAQQAGLEIANILGRQFPDISTLGLDISPATECCYVYDCNSRPGRDILIDIEIKRMAEQLARFGLDSIHSPSMR